MTTVFVLGHRGMLGHTVARWLQENGCQVRTTEARYDGRPDSPLIHEVLESRCGHVVNCIGVIPGRSSDGGALFAANALLPVHLGAVLGRGRTLVHASTDAVFNGARGGYRVGETPDAQDAYGLSKRLGELSAPGSSVVVLRTSVIGPDRASGRGLLSWFLAQRQEVSGYADHLWNGITSLQWAKLCLSVARGESLLAPCIHQPASPRPLSKYELLGHIAEVFEHRVPIRSVTTGQRIDRSLVPTIPCLPIEDQLRELRSWYGSVC
jgi:dTDP-4-dehydrorhamnose reductase